MEKIPIEFNRVNCEKILALEKIRQDNFEILQLYSDLLVKAPRIINSLAMSELGYDSSISEEVDYLALLSVVLGLDDNAEKSKRLMRKYLAESVRLLDVSFYRENPYYKNIVIPHKKIGKWEFKREKYVPFQAFIYDDITLCKDFTEIPALGFFDKEFSFPSVLEEGNEWMSIMPSEINTIAPALDQTQGKVATLGLGLGYYAYAASQKSSVSSVTVVEKSENVIALFEKYVLPQFPNKGKIKIVKDDAYHFLETSAKGENFDFLFADIWRNSYDGAQHYLKIKPFEKLLPQTKFSYWVENSILSRLRWQVFDNIYMQFEKETKKLACLNNFAGSQDSHQKESVTQYLQNEFLQNAASEGKLSKLID